MSLTLEKSHTAGALSLTGALLEASAREQISAWVKTRALGAEVGGTRYTGMSAERVSLRHKNHRESPMKHSFSPLKIAGLVALALSLSACGKGGGNPFSSTAESSAGVDTDTKSALETSQGVDRSTSLKLSAKSPTYALIGDAYRDIVPLTGYTVGDYQMATRGFRGGKRGFRVGPLPGHPRGQAGATGSGWRLYFLECRESAMCTICTLHSGGADAVERGQHAGHKDLR